MTARLARLTLWLMLAFTLVGSALSIRHFLTDPLWAPFLTATEDEIRASVETMMAKEATPQAVSARIEARLSETPRRNWLALDSLHDLAADRGLMLSPDLAARFDELRAEDHGYISEATSCAICAWDVSTCSLEQALICNAPISLTPIGDLAGIGRAVIALARGNDVDKFDLALSVVGLGSTVAVLASGGSSATVKAGAGFLRMARGMGRLSSRLIEDAAEAVRSGVDLARLPGVRSADDLKGAVKLERFAGLMATADDLNNVRAATDMTTALHLLPLVDDANDARHLAVASKALGKKVVGEAEMLGKGRLFRATVHLSKAALQFIVTIHAFVVALALMVAHGLQHLIVRPLRRHLRRVARS